jgi:hypothetical protein
MDGFDFQVEVKRTSRKKSASISLQRDSVRISVPRFISDTTIRELIDKRTPWIKKKLTEYSLRKAIKPKEYVSGEMFPYLGRNYQLAVIDGTNNSVKLIGGCLVTTIDRNKSNNKNSPKILLENWYKIKAEKKLSEKTDYFSKLIGVYPKSLIVKNYKSRWGSCSINGNLSYNWRIILAPNNIVDYVVVHELCHLLEHNHSKRYWQHVENYFPEWRNSRNWLRQNNYMGSL